MAQNIPTVIFDMMADSLPKENSYGVALRRMS